ncbi:MAG: VCBS repeat-containing protein [Myxococcales bacterium]|nr:VCBS repeat-containing protein [Myxococcales bacterium]
MRAMCLLASLAAAALFAACDVWGTSSQLLPGDGATADGEPDGGGDNSHDAGHDGGFDGGFDGGPDTNPDGGDMTGCALTQTSFADLALSLGTSQPSALAAGEFGGSGTTPDLAVGFPLEKKITAYVDLSLDSSVSYETSFTSDFSESPQALAVIEIPGSTGEDDLVVLTIPSQSGQPLHVIALENSGSSSFNTVDTLTSGQISQPNVTYNLGVGKFSGDSYPDIIATCSNRCSQAGIFPWDQDLRSFADIVSIAPGNPVDALTVADLNHDGQDDVVVGDSQMSMNTYLRYGIANGGAGVFGWNTIAEIGSSNWVREIAVADFDGDGVADVAAVVVVSNEFQLWSYRGTSSGGGFTGFSSSHATIGLGTGFSLVRLRKGDFNRDGKPDLAVLTATSPSPSSVHLLINRYFGSGIVFQDTLTVPVCSGDTSGKDLVVHDFDGNGADDLAVACVGTENTINFLRNDCQ